MQCFNDFFLNYSLANRRYQLDSVQRTKLDFDFVDGLGIIHILRKHFDSTKLALTLHFDKIFMPQFEIFSI